MKSELTRQVSTTSRELEYFSESELVTQTGHSKSKWWPEVLTKEAADNGLGACEQAGVQSRLPTHNEAGGRMAYACEHPHPRNPQLRGRNRSNI